MDTSNMNEQEARETVARMFQEMQRTLNAEGEYTESEEEYETDSDTEKTAAQATTEEPTETAPTGGEPAKKKKKKRKKPSRPTLEELLENEASLTVQEDPFDPSKTPAERVEIAVARFRKNRKFSPTQSQILSIYLAYGGIRSGPKSFQGGGVKTGGVDDDGEPDFEAMNIGIDAVDMPEEGQEVDFTNVVTTFLSQYFLESTGWVDMAYYRDTPIVVASLLNYFLVRNVLPEYEDDIKRALAVALHAKVELPLIKIISTGLPSRYDKACSLIYGGEWYGALDNSWGGPELAIATLGLDRPTAERIVQSLIGPDVDMNSLTVSPKEFMDLEIVQVDLPDLSGPESPTEEAEEAEVDALSVAMVDRMLLGEAAIEPASSSLQQNTEDVQETEGSGLHDAPVPLFAQVMLAEMDMTLPQGQQRPVDQRRRVKVYFDPAVATKMLLGMRVSAWVHTLSNGMSYLEQAYVYPTYYLEVDEEEWANESTEV
ncbi:hypothetical protein BGZ75_004878 [Mortierella antarctica]|nr:hypothetical protein BGZ75_004878 [Mortierella antarctica]